MLGRPVVAVVVTPAVVVFVQVFVNSNTKVAQGLRQEYILLKDESQDTKVSTLAFLLINVFNNNTLVFLPTKVRRVVFTLPLSNIDVFGEICTGSTTFKTSSFRFG